MSVESPETCEVLRREIDAVNQELLQLLSRRGHLVCRLAQLAGAGAAPAGRDPAREQTMLEQLCAANPGPFTDAELAVFFRCLFEVSLGLKQRWLHQGFGSDREALGK